MGEALDALCRGLDAVFFALAKVFWKLEVLCAGLVAVALSFDLLQSALDCLDRGLDQLF